MSVLTTFFHGLVKVEEADYFQLVPANFLNRQNSLDTFTRPLLLLAALHALYPLARYKSWPSSIF